MNTMWLLPQYPGPFGTLDQWKRWRDDLRTLGSTKQGVDVELVLAERWVADLETRSNLASSNSKERLIARGRMRPSAQ
jgi:hypothetical protein